uniref:Fe2OG dioxygenase domain-containing protein n=1 Tax=Timema shepardi TaxID=629360 RepID=A0A7R9ATF7_TIMSH|nr:unnamed protein product [Timema shepardi]
MIGLPATLSLLVRILICALVTFCMTTWLKSPVANLASARENAASFITSPIRVLVYTNTNFPSKRQNVTFALCACLRSMIKSQIHPCTSSNNRELGAPELAGVWGCSPYTQGRSEGGGLQGQPPRAPGSRGAIKIVRYAQCFVPREGSRGGSKTTERERSRAENGPNGERNLQHKDMTVDRAVSHLTGLKDALQDIRDTGIDVILDEASNICAATSLGIDCFFEEKRVKKRKRLTLEESEDTVLTGKQRFSMDFHWTIKPIHCIDNGTVQQVCGLKPLSEWQLYELNSNPGQRYWVCRCLRDYTHKPQRLNLDAHGDLKNGEEWWELCNKSLENKQRLFKKLRWATLGYHHNWESKIYSQEAHDTFPADLATICQFVARVAGFEDFSAEAAIVSIFCWAVILITQRWTGMLRYCASGKLLCWVGILITQRWTEMLRYCHSGMFRYCASGKLLCWVGILITQRWTEMLRYCASGKHLLLGWHTDQSELDRNAPLLSFRGGQECSATVLLVSIFCWAGILITQRWTGMLRYYASGNLLLLGWHTDHLVDRNVPLLSFRWTGMLRYCPSGKHLLLGWHTDHSELDRNAPLLSFRGGQECSATVLQVSFFCWAGILITQRWTGMFRYCPSGKLLLLGWHTDHSEVDRNAPLLSFRGGQECSATVLQVSFFCWAGILITRRWSGMLRYCPLGKHLLLGWHTDHSEVDRNAALLSFRGGQECSATVLEVSIFCWAGILITQRWTGMLRYCPSGKHLLLGWYTDHSELDRNAPLLSFRGGQECSATVLQVSFLCWAGILITRRWTGVLRYCPSGKLLLLGWHTDHSEVDRNVPLLSFRGGQECSATVLVSFILITQRWTGMLRYCPSGKLLLMGWHTDHLVDRNVSATVLQVSIFCWAGILITRRWTGMFRYCPSGKLLLLGWHTDHSEVDRNVALLSFSFGQSAIFLIGGLTVEEKPTALLVENGDIVIMSGQSRLCYHGVPRIIPAYHTPWTEDLPKCHCAQSKQGGGRQVSANQIIRTQRRPARTQRAKAHVRQAEKDRQLETYVVPLYIFLRRGDRRQNPLCHSMKLTGFTVAGALHDLIPVRHHLSNFQPHFVIGIPHQLFQLSLGARERERERTRNEDVRARVGVQEVHEIVEDVRVSVTYSGGFNPPSLQDVLRPITRQCPLHRFPTYSTSCFLPDPLTPTGKTQLDEACPCVHFSKSSPTLFMRSTMRFGLNRRSGTAGSAPPSTQYKRSENRNGSLGVLAALRFFAGGSYRLQLATTVIYASISLSVNRAITEVIVAIPLEPWLMTPIEGETNAGLLESLYNSTHSSTRNVTERCNGLLKGRFRCLLKHQVLHYSPERASSIIHACAVMHNMYIKEDLPLNNQLEMDTNENQHPERIGDLLAGGRRAGPFVLLCSYSCPMAYLVLADSSQPTFRTQPSNQQLFQNGKNAFCVTGDVEPLFSHISHVQTAHVGELGWKRFNLAKLTIALHLTRINLTFDPHNHANQCNIPACMKAAAIGGSCAASCKKVAAACLSGTLVFMRHCTILFTPPRFRNQSRAWLSHM